ncbi:MAG: ATP-binding cassette domain-containing protein [Cyanobacteria bacterium M_surface_7_m2_040]|nr:ATP-binding cassette domain-containing protein [Cyanobacteria bacterium K_Offshore_0m_m2_072]MBM5809097.1 ATP-binding cassette domain-containing protein [Cyanobacteria bacterium M_surface_9_m1_291]MBM5826600.1 ATP-binding cassette domain-containing protein [Cyanobacteria bacterium M_surface_7_m2_040]
MALTISDLSWGHPIPGGGWRQLFQGFDLGCEPGQFVTVIGNNGSGKSTLLNLIAGALKQSGGTIELGGRPLHRYPDHRRARWIGRVMQNPLEGTCPGLTIAENLRLAERRRHSGLSASGLLGLRPSGADRRRYRALLDDLNIPLAQRLDALVGELSGGQRQTLSLVMATMGQPELLLLDEHTAALDPKAEALVMELTERLVRQLGATTLMVTHSLEQALSFGDRLLMLRDGQLAHDWTATERQQLSADALRQLYGSGIVAPPAADTSDGPATP